jgi:hypothetical protein
MMIATQVQCSEPGFEVFVIEIEAEDIKLIERRMEWHRRVKESDPSLYSLEFWDHSMMVYPSGAVGDEIEDTLYAGLPVRLPNDVKISMEMTRTSCGCMVVMNDEVYWTFQSTEDNGEFSTPILKLAVLKELFSNG